MRSSSQHSQVFCSSLPLEVSKHLLAPPTTPWHSIPTLTVLMPASLAGPQFLSCPALPATILQRKPCACIVMGRPLLHPNPLNHTG